MITLHTLAQASAQEVFNQGALHMLTQSEKSKAIFDNSKILSCAYRGDRDLRCPAGCFISDDEYKLEFEGMRWQSLVREPVVYCMITGLKYDLSLETYKTEIPHQQLICNLQGIHDMYNVDEWPKYLVFVAQITGLSPAIVTASAKAESLTTLEKDAASSLLPFARQLIHYAGGYSINLNKHPDLVPEDIMGASENTLTFTK